MKILFITSQPIIPPISGLRKKIFLIAKELKEKGNILYLFSFAKLENDKEIIFKEIEFAESINKKNLIFKFLLSFLNNPFEAVFYMKGNSFKKLKKFIKRIKPDLIFVDYIRIAHIFPYLQNYETILNIDDPQSLKYLKMKKNLKEIENPFGEALSNFPEVIQKFLKTYLIKKILISYEIKMMQKYERKWARLYKVVLTNSENDRKYLNKIGIKNVKLLPPLIEIKEEKIKIEKKENYLLFVGKMDYAPNPDAVDYFINEIFPLIREKYPEIEFWIVGSNMNKEQKKKWEKEKNVKVIGRVPNLEPYYRKAKVFVCPLRFGTGIKVKILEAMQYGAPVVTTEVGAEGIGGVDGEHFLIAKNEKDFAEKVSKLITKDGLNIQIIKNAYEFVKENYNVTKWIDMLIDLPALSNFNFQKNNLIF